MSTDEALSKDQTERERERGLALNSINLGRGERGERGKIPKMLSNCLAGENNGLRAPMFCGIWPARYLPQVGGRALLGAFLTPYSEAVWYGGFGR